MARQALIRGPDLDSARRDADTGVYTDTVGRVRPRSAAKPMALARAFQPRRSPRGRTATVVRRASGSRRLT